MKTTALATLAIATMLAFSAAQAQPFQTAGQDMKNAGHNTANAGKDVGHATVRGTKTATRDTKNGSKTAYRKTSNASKTGYHKTTHATKTGYHKTVNGTDRTVKDNHQSPPPGTNPR